MTFKTREIFFQLFTLTKSPIFLHLKFFWLFLGIWSGADKCNPVVPDVFWSAPNWVESLVLWCGWVEFIVGIIGKHDKVGDSLSIIIITSNFSKLETGKKKWSVSFFFNTDLDKVVGKDQSVLASLALLICCEVFRGLEIWGSRSNKVIPIIHA